MSCKYLQSFIDSINSWLLFVTVVWMVAVGETKLIVEGQLVFHSALTSCFTRVMLYIAGFCGKV